MDSNPVMFNGILLSLDINTQLSQVIDNQVDLDISSQVVDKKAELAKCILHQARQFDVVQPFVIVLNGVHADENCWFNCNDDRVHVCILS